MDLKNFHIKKHLPSKVIEEEIQFNKIVLQQASKMLDEISSFELTQANFENDQVKNLYFWKNNPEINEKHIR